MDANKYVAPSEAMRKDTRIAGEQTQVMNIPAPIRVVDRLAVEIPHAISEEKLYEENAKVTAIFWEWRHKVLTHFFGVSGAFIAGTGWLYHASQSLRWWHCFPLLLAANYSFMSYKIDKRHTQILRESYSIAAGIEPEARTKGSIFTYINGIPYDGGSLTQILHRLYRASGLLFVVAAVLVDCCESDTAGTLTSCHKGSVNRSTVN
jgi:hypothetical protein